MSKTAGTVCAVCRRAVGYVSGTRLARHGNHVGIRGRFCMGSSQPAWWHDEARAFVPAVVAMAQAIGGAK